MKSSNHFYHFKYDKFLQCEIVDDQNETTVQCQYWYLSLMKEYTNKDLWIEFGHTFRKNYFKLFIFSWANDWSYCRQDRVSINLSIDWFNSKTF